LDGPYLENQKADDAHVKRYLYPQAQTPLTERVARNYPQIAEK
jgi:hypothetical protein